MFYSLQIYIETLNLRKKNAVDCLELTFIVMIDKISYLCNVKVHRNFVRIFKINKKIRKL